MTVLKASQSPRIGALSVGNHRLDIQGLRGVALLMAVAFHAGLPVPGGFIGVDIFFVISGFVITGMIDRERSRTGRFNFGQFYLRRFKRLIPALALVVGVTMVLSFFLLSPFGTQQMAAETGAAAMLLSANFVIAWNTGDYFGVSARSNPLVHSWSLSVEEQFYLIFPAILLLGWVLSQRGRHRPWAAIFIGAAALLSFHLATFGDWALGPLAPFAKYLVGYYGPLGRWWEFAVGALLALATGKRSLISARHAPYFSWLGIGLILCLPWLLNGTMHYPGPWTLLPVAGTSLLIATGTHNSTWVNRALTLPALVKLGDWSYSIYLWHWPLMVFATTLWPQVSYAAVLAAAVCILPALSSYRWVEQPVRKLPPLGPRRTTALIAAVISPAILLAVTVGLAADHYWLPRYNSGYLSIAHQGDVDDWASYFAHLRDTYYPCTDQAIRDNAPTWHGFTRCRQSKPGSRIDIAVIGDSRAEHLFVGLAEASPNKNIAYYSPDVPPTRSAPWRSASGAMDRIIDHVASDPSIKTVIVNAGWGARELKEDELVKTFEAFRSKGKAVFTTDDVPAFNFDPIACKYRMAPILSFAKCTEDKAVIEALYVAYYHKLQDAVRKVPGVQLLNTMSYFCDDHVCSMTKGEVILYRDQYHLNDAGSRFLVNRMLNEYPEFRAGLTGP
jgi:peptidoglycan/LPS O-acetylase OafA/YrhL